MRINKYLKDCGVCSRREADVLISEGRVTVNGRTAGLGDQADETSLVEVDGRKVELSPEKTYLKLYKPVGIVCTFEKREKNNLRSFLNYPVPVSYAGRLDKNSEGLLILTDDGELINRMMAARNAHEKEYEVSVDREIPEEVLQRLAQGVRLKELGVTTRPCRIRKTGDKSFSIVLTQGLNRQIRRMCSACGYTVRSLKRIRVVNILLGDMKPGEYRRLTSQELEELKKTVMRP